MRSEQEVNSAIERYGDMVYRICKLHLKSEADTEDIFQTVFFKYLLYQGTFQDGEHEKAWLIRVTVNACKDLLRSFFRRKTVALEAAEQLAASQPEDHREVLEAVFSLPEKYRDAIYLFYYERYTGEEIGAILGKNINTVYTLLSRGKKLLYSKLGGEDNG